MRRGLFVAVVAALAWGTSAAVGVAAGAAAKTDPTKFCNAVSSNFSSIGSASSDRAEAKRVQTALNRSAGYASGNVKAATKTLADFYGKIAKGATYTAALSAMAGKYGKAAATFTSYVATKCPSVVLGTTTTSGSSTSGGSSGSGSATATTIVGSSLECSADRTALDAVETAYKALKGTYGDMDALIAAGLLKEPSQYHTISVSGGGTSYTVQGC